jgi:hypothetical protein
MSQHPPRDIAPSASLLLAIALALAGSLAACGPDPAAPAPLDERERRLVEEVLTLMEVRIERARDPERATALRDSLGPFYSDAEIEALVGRLAAHPRRAHLFAQAVKDSLDQRRARLFPAQNIVDPQE